MAFFNESEMDKIRVIERMVCPTHGASPRIVFDGEGPEPTDCCCDEFAKSIETKLTEVVGGILKDQFSKCSKSIKLG